MSLCLPFPISFGIAAMGFSLLGNLAIAPFAQRAGRPLLLSSLYFGQMLAWFGSYLVLPFNAGLARSIGVSIPRPVLSPPGLSG